MKLIHYPNVMKVFHEIADGCPCCMPDGEAVVPKNWIARFNEFEAILIKHGDKTVRETKAPIDDLSILDGEDPNVLLSSKVWEVIAMPVNDDDSVILKAIGCSPETIANIRLITNEYFDGESGELIHMKKGNP